MQYEKFSFTLQLLYPHCIHHWTLYVPEAIGRIASVAIQYKEIMGLWARDILVSLGGNDYQKLA